MQNTSKHKVANVIKHVAFEDLGSLQLTLSRRGYKINYIEAGYDELKEIDTNAALLVILGGPIGVYDEKYYPFIKQEIQIIEDRINKNLPTMGICLGAQLIAKALGANVYGGKTKEIGWSSLTLTPHGKENYFHYLDGSNTQVLHWHGDTFDLPKGAVLQASTDIYENQAFTYNKNTLALQFHPEVNAKGLEKWFIGHANEIFSNRISIEKIREDAKLHEKNLNVYSERFFSSWLEETGDK